MFQRNTFVSALLASALALPAFAQDAAAPATAAPAAPEAEAGAQSTGIEEIQITARKVSENLQEAPLAVSAFDAETLDSLGVSDTRDISAIAPNLYFTQTPGSVANLALSIRGVGGAEPLLTREQGVAIYMDGAYIARVTGGIMDLVDIERVEVLRGPQGTLYGRNATGGAVNFISRRPTEEFGFTSRIGVGGYGRLDGGARVNTGELLPGLAASIGYVHSQSDGFVNNRLRNDHGDPGARNSDAFRVALGWDVSEELRLDYAFDYANLEGKDHAFQLITMGPSITNALNTGSFSIGGPGISLVQSRSRLDDLSMDNDGVSEHTTTGHNLSAEYDFGFATIKSITTYREWENSEAGTELDGNVIPTFLGLISPTFAPGVVSGRSLFSANNERHQDQWTQEIQVLGELGDQFRYVTGFYYFKEDYTEANVQSFLFPIQIGPGTFLPGVFDSPFAYSGDARSWALFANGTYTLPFLDERLAATAGVRYSKDEKSFDRTSFPATANSANWSHVDWEFNLNFLATENITTYFRAASAYKAGGFNLRSAVAPIAPFKEEELTSIEAGVKSEWFDNRVRVNLTGFWSTYKNLQTDVFAAGTAGATSLTINAGEAEIPGLEAEFLAVPIDGLTINANVGWIQPKYNEYNVVNNNGTTVVCTAPGVPVGCLPNPFVDDFVQNVASDAKFGYKPQVTATIGAEYATPPIGSFGWVITPRIDARYTASRVWSPLDDQAPRPDATPFRDVLADSGYWLLDARVTISEMAIGERAKVRMAVFGKNITNEEYLLSAIDFGALDFAGGIFGEPATWGVDLVVDF